MESINVIVETERLKEMRRICTNTYPIRRSLNTNLINRWIRMK